MTFTKNIFDRLIVKKHRDRALSNYFDNNFLFLETASRLTEKLDEITKPLINKMGSDEDRYFNIPINRTIEELRNILENRYSEILKIDFKKKESNQNFWFISKNK